MNNWELFLLKITQAERKSRHLNYVWPQPVFHEWHENSHLIEYQV